MTAPITLYRHALSGHAHRVELFLSLLGLPFERIDVDLARGAHKQPAFLAKNPLGQVPVIEDGALTLADSNAILVYLALKYDGERRYLPRDPETVARIQRWLSLAASDLVSGPGNLRLAALFGAPIDRPSAERAAARLFAVMESDLTVRPYLVGDAPTLADVALYSYTAVAPEGGVSLEPYPATRAWLARIESLAGFVAMQRTLARSR